MVTEGKYWLEDMGLGIWHGKFKKNTRFCLRWYDADGSWLPTETEDERQQRYEAQKIAGQERSRADRLTERLKELGIDPNEV